MPVLAAVYEVAGPVSMPRSLVHAHSPPHGSEADTGGAMVVVCGWQGDSAGQG